jgi:hypothetical protein
MVVSFMPEAYGVNTEKVKGEGANRCPFVSAVLRGVMGVREHRFARGFSR